MVIDDDESKVTHPSTVIVVFGDVMRDPPSENEMSPMIVTELPLETTSCSSSPESDISPMTLTILSSSITISVFVSFEIMIIHSPD